MNLEKKYKTTEGIECNILQLVKMEPEWAANIIQYYEQKIEQQKVRKVIDNLKPIKALEVEMGEKQETNDLDIKTIKRCLNIAKGCFDYRGGYHDEKELKIYHHGIQTVINCLEAFIKNDSNDFQLQTVEHIGSQN